MNKKTVYKAKHPNQRPKPKNQEKDYWSLLRIQLLVCGVILMGILVFQRFPDSGGLHVIRRSITTEMAFSRNNHWYERFMINLFPFSYMPANLLPEATIAVVGEGDGEEGIESLTAALVRNINFGLELHYADGIIVNTFQEDIILSPVAGVIIDKGTDRSHEIGDYVVIQLTDNSTVTVGFLQNIRVGLLDHIQVGTQLGNGTVIEDLGEEAYFYLSVQNQDGDFLDTLAFLNQLVQNEQAN